jgi:hypothetical protein
MAKVLAVSAGELADALIAEDEAHAKGGGE